MSAAPAVVKNISGTVTDTDGEPLIGATVSVKGTTHAISTDIDGNYTLKASVGQVIAVSYIGYSPAEAVVGAKDVINFTLSTNAEALDEVVVVGYGTVKKKDLTGAVGAVNGEKMTDRHTTMLSTALQGALSGVQVLRTSGSPSAGASSIRIRGVTTTGTSDPLILVDGVPETSINNINANDVESISVLKDAASASIYGSRAAAGVILVTTKRAAEKELKVSYNFEYSLEIPAAQPKNVGPTRYMEMVNELSYNDNPAGGWNQIFSQDQVANWETLNATDPDNYPITNWFDYMTKGSAPRQSHVVTLTGGSKYVKSRVSMSYDRREGLLKDVDQTYNRYLIRANNDFTFNKYLAANLDLNVKYTESNAPDFSAWNQIYQASELYTPFWSNGSVSDVKDGNNVYARTVYGGYTKSTTLRTNGKMGITLTPIEGLKLQAIASPDFTFSKTKNATYAVPFYRQDDPNTIAGYMSDYIKNTLTETRADSKTLTAQLIGTYSKKFGKHDLNVMLGYETYYYFHESESAGSEYLDLDQYPYLSVANKNNLSVDGTAYENAMRSLFGRVMYNYDDRYLVQVNFRRDGSSRFHRDYRWGNFPSVSVGWVMSKEKFMKDVSPKALSFLKIRGSWGLLGNERIGNYPYISLMEAGNSLIYSSSDATTATYWQSMAQVQYAIANISWETTESYDLGIDARFLDGRLSFTGDIYRKNTKDMLLSLDIPKYVGYTNPSQNAGKMHTTGFDLDLGWQDRIGEVEYGVTFNLSDYRSKMGNLSGTMVDDVKVVMEGSYYNEWYGYISDGLFQTEEEVANSAKLNSSTQVGDVKFRDISGPDGVPDGVISPEYDRVLLGNSLPEMQFGGTINAAWRGFDLSMAFQGVGHQNVRMTESMIQPYRGKWGSIPAILDGNYWSTLNTTEQNEAARYPRLTTTNKDSNNAMSTFWMFNGAYFRMKNITIGYTLPKKLTRQFFVERLRFYVSTNDLFCLNHYPTGFDPERTVSSYPITSSVIFGANVNF
jgi:TonB-linked SusC/RagA family outer membrane protein